MNNIYQKDDVNDDVDGDDDELNFSKTTIF